MLVIKRVILSITRDCLGAKAIVKPGAKKPAVQSDDESAPSPKLGMVLYGIVWYCTEQANCIDEIGRKINGTWRNVSITT